jgi:surface-anchored protein
LAWAFTQPGTYAVVLEASGTLVAGSRTTSSGPVTFTFSVGAGAKVLDMGHTDLAINYSTEEGVWDVHVGSDLLEETYDADDVILQVNGEAKTTVPASAQFSFLGAPGDPVWILTQAENEKLLYLGYGGDGIPDGVFAGDQVKVLLRNASGPGDFFSYTVDGLGNPVVDFNTRDGITTADVATVQAGGDAHLNWAFTQPGDYAVTLEVSGTLGESNQSVSSGPVTYHFSVLKPIVPLTVEHVDLAVLYDASAPNPLSIVARDENARINYQTNETVLVVAEAAKISLPSGTPFGPEAAPLWVLPQSQNPALLYLGLSAEGIAPGAFTGNLTFRLLGLDGPGQFYLWQASQFGGFDIQMNSADGISEADSHAQIIGSHEHFNFGFSTNGIYHLTFQASGRLAGQTTNLVSPEATFTFRVLPLPSNATPVNIQLRQAHVASNGDFAVDVVGAADKTVEIQATEDFGQWSAVGNMTIRASPQRITIPAGAARSHRFFRLLVK